MIASVVSGGIGTVFGTLLIGVVRNGLALNNAGSYVQQVIDVIIVLTVAFDTFAKARRRRA